ncbi:MAG: DUF4157 domain-containing protein, partial [Dehalococcoidales bacterium]
MPKRKPVSRDEAEDKGRSQHKKPGHSEDGFLKSPDEGVTGSLGESSFEGHSALLASAQSDRQRANLVMRLQQSHGNAYVQRLFNSGLVQAKLTVNPPDDQYEKEADRVADKVMQVKTPDVQRQLEDEEEPVQTKVSDIQRGALPGEEEEEEEDEEEMEAEAAMGAPGPAPAAPPAPPPAPAPPAPAAAPAPAPERRGIPAPPGASGGGYEEAMGMGEYEGEEEEEAEEEALGLKRSNDIQRQEMPEEEEEPLQPKASDIQRQDIPEEELQAKASDIQRQEEPEEEEEEEAVQTKAGERSAFEVSGNLEQRIEAARGSGQPLQESTRGSLESQLGHDFNNVRIHNDAEADKLSRQLGAEAFTTGRDVFFKEGTYNPDSDHGQGLIAHELTHVVQQSAVPEIQRQSVTEKEAKGAELGGGKAVDEA